MSWDCDAAMNCARLAPDCPWGTTIGVNPDKGAEFDCKGVTTWTARLDVFDEDVLIGSPKINHTKNVQDKRNVRNLQNFIEKKKK